MGKFPFCIWFYSTSMSGWNKPLPPGQSAAYHSGVMANKFSQSRAYPEVRERSSYIGPLNPWELETSKLATTHILSSKLRLATARVLCFHPLPTPKTAPSLSPRNISVATISSERAATFPHCLRQWNCVSVMDRRNCKDGVQFSEFSVFSRLSFSLILLIMIYWSAL